MDLWTPVAHPFDLDTRSARDGATGDHRRRGDRVGEILLFATENPLVCELGYAVNDEGPGFSAVLYGVLLSVEGSAVGLLVIDEWGACIGLKCSASAVGTRGVCGGQGKAGCDSREDHAHNLLQQPTCEWPSGSELCAPHDSCSTAMPQELNIATVGD